MIWNKVVNLFIGDGSAAPTAGSQVSASVITPGDIAVVGLDNTVIGVGKTVSDHPIIKIAQGTSKTLNGTSQNQVKMSMDIPLKRVTAYNAAAYQSPTLHTVAIGYSRKAAAGSMVVANSTAYEFTVDIRSDKNIYGSRLPKRMKNFTSAASATQSNVCDQIVSLVNSDTFLNRYIVAIKVGDGTGVYGVTGATNFGVEFTAKDVANDLDFSYTNERVYFGVELGTAFSTTTAQVISIGMKKGSGTYTDVYLTEKYVYSMAAMPNLIQWPYSIPTYDASSTTYAGTMSPTATGTAGEDKVTFSASVSGILSEGDQIVISSNTYVIKYFISTTVAVLTSVLLTSPSGTAVTKKFQYGIISIEFSNPTYTLGSGQMVDNSQQVLIAVPQIDASTAYNAISAQAAAIFNVLNPLMNSVGFASQSF